MIFNKRRASSQSNVHCCLFLFFVFFCLVIFGYAFKLPLWLSLHRRGLLVGRLGGEKQNSRGGRWEGEREEERLPPFPSSPRPPRAYHFFFLIFVEITAGARAVERVYDS